MMRRDRRGEMGVAVWAGLPGPAVPRSGSLGRVGAPTLSVGAVAQYSRQPSAGSVNGEQVGCGGVRCRSLRRRQARLVEQLNEAWATMTDPMSTDEEILRAADEYEGALKAYIEGVSTYRRCCGDFGTDRGD